MRSVGSQHAHNPPGMMMPFRQICEFLNDIPRSTRRRSRRRFDRSSCEVLECRTLLSAVPILVKDIIPGFTGSAPENLTNVNGTLFFAATYLVGSTVYGHELWKSDGTAVGTVMVKDIYPGPLPSLIKEMTNFNGKLFFAAITPGSGLELWKSDGTEAGTVMVKEIRPGVSGASIRDLTVVGDRLYFVANDGVTGSEVWVTDGTEQGTHLVMDMVQGLYRSDPTYLTNVNGTLYFMASARKEIEQPESGGSNRQIYKVEQSRVVRVTNLDPQANEFDGIYMRSLVVSGDHVFFHGLATNGMGSEVWTLDNSVAGATIPRNINGPAYQGGSGPSDLMDVNGTLFFVASEIESGRELWLSDGTTAGTYLVKDITPGNGSTSFVSFVKYNGRLLFTIDNGTNNAELWISDGTEAGTKRIKTFPGYSAGLINTGISFNGLLYFGARNEVSGAELWRSDGTPEGTYQVVDTVPGSGSSYPHNFVNVNGRLFLVNSTPDVGAELWMLGDSALPATDISLSASNLVEGNAPGVVVGTLSSNDPDSGNTGVFTLVSGVGSADNGSFSITGNQLKINTSTVFAVKSQYQIRIRVTDPDNLTFEKRFTITVTAAVDSPTTISLQSTALPYAYGSKDPIVIDPSATLVDSDTPNPQFAGALLRITGLRKKDVVTIKTGGAISRKGKKIFFGSTLIGVSTGGIGKAMTVELTGEATLDRVQALLRTISFSTKVGLDVNLPISMQITRINNMQTNIATRVIRIFHLV